MFKFLNASADRPNGMADPLTRVRRAARTHAAAREEFDAAIRAAVRERTMREVAAAAGISPARVHQIVHAP
jgi:hypothetical protein